MKPVFDGFQTLLKFRLWIPKLFSLLLSFPLICLQTYGLKFIEFCFIKSFLLTFNIYGVCLPIYKHILFQYLFKAKTYFNKIEFHHLQTV